MIDWAYRRADVLTAISQNTKREILKIIPDLKIIVINHGVDFYKFQETRNNNQTNLKSEILNLKPFILSVGTLKKRKGYEYSIAAFAEIAGEFPELKYVIVGRGPEREALKLQVTSYKLQDRVIFLDNLSEAELIDLYHNAELFILLPQDINKDMEGFGLVFLEAAACGLAVVSANGSSAEDAVLDGQNGILVPPQDMAAAAAAMVRILSDRKFKESLAKESLAFAQKMSWHKTARAYIALYWIR
ncbi:MAG: glycosyltransferase family 4 protein [Parcubacteria group bacterium]|nr:glycosyltransferase family 4 protein [Parcubacteria group bacterium]